MQPTRQPHTPQTTLLTLKMNSLNTLPYTPLFPQSSFSTKRRRRRQTKPKKFSHILPPTTSPDPTSSTDPQSIKLILDVNRINLLTSTKLQRFLNSASDAYEDLRSLITVDENKRVVFSCRKSTLEFSGLVLLCGFVGVCVFRGLVKLGLAFRGTFGDKSRNAVIVRRDRSLGGREVVVSMRDLERENMARSRRNRVLENPLSDGFGSGLESSEELRRYYYSGEKGNSQKLPNWWPEKTVDDSRVVVNLEECQRNANRLVRAITNYRTAGKEFAEHDIIQLRRICRAAGVKVSFDTTNTRDNFYRASVNFVLDVCSRSPGYSNRFQLDDEDPRQFVAGLAENIGLENTRAAIIVSAAVAARTHSCFLQAWALEVQGKQPEAILELSKICPVLQAFPPDESSPEMEMVARGLGKHLKVEQRKRLMNIFVSTCGKESHRSAADALGLILSPGSVGDEQENKHTGI